MLQRLRTLSKRRSAAKRFGLEFQRQRSFQLPSRIDIPGGDPIHIPEDQLTIAADFINVILDDEYGLSQIKEPPKIILDIGANIGLFSWLAYRTWPEAAIFAFEPNPMAYKFACKNAPHVNLSNAAIGKTPGRASLTCVNQWRMGKIESDADGTVEIVSLADAIEIAGGSIDFAKVDIEGFEWQLFEDKESLSRIKRLHMEYHLVDQKTQSMFESTVKSLGFQIEHMIKDNGFGIAWLRR